MSALAILPLLTACAAEPEAILPQPQPQPQPGPRPLAAAPGVEFYRKYTEAMLRRYMRFSMEIGRTPSMLGREIFRARVTSYRMRSFEDTVIFVHDVERSIQLLAPEQQILIARIALQEYTHQETAEMLGQTRRTVVRRYMEALDCLTAIFLKRRLLEPRFACQEVEG